MHCARLCVRKYKHNESGHLYGVRFMHIVGTGEGTVLEVLGYKVNYNINLM